MPINVKQEDGTEVEAFTAEELEQQKQVAIEEFKAENPDKTQEIADLQEQLRKGQEEIAKLSDKDKNFTILKGGVEKRLATIDKEIEEKINVAKREVLEGVMSDHENDMLKVLSGGDTEVEKKIEYHYKRLGDVAATKEEITNKLKDAYVLATKKEPDAVNASIYGSGNVGRLNINNTTPKFSAEDKELGAKFGLKPEDFK